MRRSRRAGGIRPSFSQRTKVRGESPRSWAASVTGKMSFPAFGLPFVKARPRKAVCAQDPHVPLKVPDPRAAVGHGRRPDEQDPEAAGTPTAGPAGGIPQGVQESGHRSSSSSHTDLLRGLQNGRAALDAVAEPGHIIRVKVVGPAGRADEGRRP